MISSLADLKVLIDNGTVSNLTDLKDVTGNADSVVLEYLKESDIKNLGSLIRDVTDSVISKYSSKLGVSEEPATTEEDALGSIFMEYVAELDFEEVLRYKIAMDKIKDIADTSDLTRNEVIDSISDVLFFDLDIKVR